MTNKSSSKQHGLVGNIRPKKTGARKNNKLKAQARRAESPKVRKVTA